MSVRPTCVELHEAGGEVLLGHRVRHEAHVEGGRPVLHRRVYHIEDLYDLKITRILRSKIIMDFTLVTVRKIGFETHL